METTALMALMTWVGLETGYATSAIPPPHIVLMTPREITTEYYEGAPHAIPEGGIDPRVNALYAPGDGTAGTIYVLAPEFVKDPLDEGDRNPVWREMIVHELVHHLQWRSGANQTWACPRGGEREAYAVAGRWLRAVGADDPLPNCNFWGAIYGRC